VRAEFNAMMLCYTLIIVPDDTQGISQVVLLDNSQTEHEYPLYARDGWEIPTAIAPNETFKSLRRRNREVESWFPKAALRSISHPDYRYNCVGMIFASRRKWIEIDYIAEILVHDGYRKIIMQSAMVGDIILYRNHKNEYTHVALITNIEKYGDTMNIKVLSKWGRDGEFEHFVADVPSTLGMPVEYWTERQLL